MNSYSVEEYLLWKLGGRISDELLRPHTSLVVDGDDWLLYLLHETDVFGSEYGGNYENINKFICREIERLVVCKLQLVFVFSIDPIESEDEQVMKWNALVGYCYGKSKSAEFPTPPLLKQQLIVSLKSLAVEVKFCENNIVHEIARIVIHRNSAVVNDRNQPISFVYARNSDYFAVKGCPYIILGTLEIVLRRDAYTVIETYVARAKNVWTRRNVSALLNITEEQLIDWLLLIECVGLPGIDRTTDFNVAVHGSLIGSSIPVLDGLLQTVVCSGGIKLKEAACDYRDGTRVQRLRALNYHINHRRAYFDLLPMVPTYRPPPFQHVHSGRVSSDFDLAHYEAHNIDGYFADLGRYLSAHQDGGGTNSDAHTSLAELAILYLSYQCDNASDNSTPQAVFHIHLMALRAMLQHIREVTASQQCQPPGSSVVTSCLPAGLSVPVRPVWEDVKAAFVFQKTCVAILEYLPADALTGKQITPEQIYHGALFHVILQQIRVEKRRQMELAALLQSPVARPSASGPVGATHVSHLTPSSQHVPVVAKQSAHILHSQPPRSLSSFEAAFGLGHNLSSSSPSVDSDPPPAPPPAMAPSIIPAAGKSQLTEIANLESAVLAEPSKRVTKAERKAERRAERLANKNAEPVKQTKKERKAAAAAEGAATVKKPAAPPTTLSVILEPAASNVTQKVLRPKKKLPTSTSNISIAEAHRLPPAPIRLEKSSVQAALAEALATMSGVAESGQDLADEPLQVFARPPPPMEQQAAELQSHVQPHVTAPVATRYIPPPLQRLNKARAQRVPSKSQAFRVAHDTLPPAAELPDMSDVYDMPDMPIDAFRSAILQRVRSERLVFIQGETGCGKSSRLPQFLLEEAESSGAPCHIIVSQPRRVAVMSILQHLRPTLGDKVGMRMGFGERDETEATVIHYVTSGYLVGSMASRSSFVRRCTHLIIDEVHERSADGDLACMFAKEALRTNPDLRVILMSATVHVALYRDYFSQHADASYGSMECLSVGRRRFPVSILYAEDLHRVAAGGAGRSSRGAIAAFQDSADKLCELGTPSTLIAAKEKSAQLTVAFNLVMMVGRKGTSVLIFLNGMADITELVIKFEECPDYLVLPLHSLIPHEEQDLIFSPTPPDKVKVILSTNIAESSMTIPDCDVVICLGTQKALQYSAEMHRSQLSMSVISKASAEQRAGRTGRTRPGTVYRLYARACYEEMREHALSEVLEIPLQDLMLKLWCLLDGARGFKGMSVVLSQLIEPPDTSNITQSYEQLYLQDLITAARYDAKLTSKGRIVGALPVECRLGKMITTGIILGVAAEAIILAALMSLPCEPFRHVQMMYGSANGNNASLRKKFLASVEFDAGCYSEPIMWLRILQRWRGAGDHRAKLAFCHQHGLQHSTMAQFESSVKIIRTALSRHLPAELRPQLTSDEDAMHLSPSKINLLRLIMVWASSGNVIQLRKKKNRRNVIDADDSVTVHCDGITPQHWDAFFGTVPHQYTPINNSERRAFSTTLPSWNSADFFMSLVQIVDGLIPLAAKHTVPLMWIAAECDGGKAHFVVIVMPLSNIPQKQARSEHAEDLTSGVHRCFPLEKLKRGEDYRAVLCENSPNAATDCLISVVPDADAAEVYKLEELGSSLGNSVSLAINPDRKAQITLFRCDLDVELLQQALAAAKLKEKESDYGVLSFPVVTETSTGNLIYDLSLGHRLLCYSHFIDVERRFALKMNAEVHDGAKASKGGTKLDVKVDCCSPSWLNLRTIVTAPQEVYHREAAGEENRHSREQISALLPRQSMLACSAHRGSEPLFAVALRTKLIGLGGNQIMCEGVSFLPLGPTWLQLALLCVGADADAVLSACPDHASSATEQQVELAAQVEEMLFWAKEAAPRPDIVELIDEIFLSVEVGEKVGNSSR